LIKTTGTRATFEACVFDRNVATKTTGGGNDGGAGSILSGSSAQFIGCLIQQNEAEGNGGGFYVDGALTNLGLNETVLERNNAKLFGGGLYFQTSYPAETFCRMATGSVSYNHAGASGGGVYMTLASAYYHIWTHEPSILLPL
jgi:predicted outer membrane repeat protein